MFSIKKCNVLNAVMMAISLRRTSPPLGASGQGGRLAGFVWPTLFASQCLAQLSSATRVP